MPSPAFDRMKGSTERPGPPRVLEDLVVEARRHHEREPCSASRGCLGPPMARRSVAPPASRRAPARCRCARWGCRPPASDSSGHEPVMQNSPRGRWYLNDRAVMSTPAAASGRADRVAFEAAIVLAVQREPDRPVAVDRIAVATGQTLAHAMTPGRPARRHAGRDPADHAGCGPDRVATSRGPRSSKVCRSARNQLRHPSRCSHHSVCHPLTFSR